MPPALCVSEDCELAPVFQKVDSTIQRINLYVLENAIGFHDTSPLNSYLSGGSLRLDL